ncbi:jg22176 [Pararge aegeria aegeria]|uniref:Jg22176 protein n=1 Tax=Pararge aegeria aegeria TaxID=348720 RepID=A0A8S4QEE2_9NEOP|nr:jg22176 [Pararge aegeria aegeria]
MEGIPIVPPEKSRKRLFPKSKQKREKLKEKLLEYSCHHPSSSRACRTRRLREYNGERAAASSVLLLPSTAITNVVIMGKSSRCWERPLVQQWTIIGC